MARAVNYANSGGRDYKGGRVGKVKEVLAFSQREIINFWQSMISEIEHSSSEEAPLREIWQEIKNKEFEKKGLGNGFAALALLEPMGFVPRLPNGETVNVTKLISEYKTINLDEKILLMKLVFNLMETKELNSELRQYNLFEAFEALCELMLIEKIVPVKQYYSTHIGCATTTVKLSMYFEQMQVGESIRIATGEHALTIYCCEHSKFKIIDPNANMVESLENSFDQKKCAEKLFDYIFPGINNLSNISLNLCISCYTYRKITAAQLHHQLSLPDLQSAQGEIELFNRNATELLVAATNNDIFGVDKYCKLAEGQRCYLETRYNIGTDTSQYSQNALERAIILKHSECAITIIKGLLQTGYKISEIKCQTCNSSERTEALSVFEYCALYKDYKTLRELYRLEKDDSSLNSTLNELVQKYPILQEYGKAQPRINTSGNQNKFFKTLPPAKAIIEPTVSQKNYNCCPVL